MKTFALLRHRAAQHALALGLGLASWFGSGSALADPMRPLDFVATPSPQAAVTAGPAAAPVASRLSATRSDGAGRWEALVGTTWLRAGDRLDGARVEEVGANHVLLLRGSRRQTVYLIEPLQPSRATSPRALPASASRY